MQVNAALVQNHLGASAPYDLIKMDMSVDGSDMSTQFGEIRRQRNDPDSQPPFVRRLPGPRCAPVKPGVSAPRVTPRCAPRRLDPWHRAPRWRGTRAPQDGGGTAAHLGTDSPPAALPQVPVGPPHSQRVAYGLRVRPLLQLVGGNRAR